MINEFLFYRMLVGEYASSISRIIAIVTRYTSDTLSFSPYKERLEAAKLKYDEAIEKVNTQLLTEEVHLMDSHRDSAIMALEGYVLACSRRLDEDWSAAGAAILNEIESHGTSISRKPLAVETSVLELLISKLKSDAVLAKAMETINGASWLTEIETANEEYKDSVSVRKDTKAAKSDEVTTDACKNIRKELEAFFKYLEVMSDYNPQAEFTSVIKEINVVVSEINTIIAQRKGRSQTTADMADAEG